MTPNNDEAVAIARLLAEDRTRILGWVYRWGTDELGIRWVGDARDVAFIDRRLDTDVLMTANAGSDGDLVRFLTSLPVGQFLR